MPRYLDQWFDPEITLNDDDTLISLTEADIARLQVRVAIARYAKGTPRRLGGDASAEELARDKKVGRRIEHMLTQALVAMCGSDEVAPPTQDERSEAATLDWEAWVANEVAYLEERSRYIATWARMHNELKWGRRQIVKYSNLINWLQHSLR